MHKIYDTRDELLSTLNSGLNNARLLPTHDLVYEDLLIEPVAAQSLHELKLWLEQSKVPEKQIRIAKEAGLVTLFEGPSSSTKLLMANLLAGQAGLGLAPVHLTKVVSKFAAETEKNLAKIFERAKKEGQVLFFDEAEALFGKRTNVKDAHDKYANIELSYFIQHAATNGTLTIISATSKGNLDDAFLRRLRFIVSFPLPK